MKARPLDLSQQQTREYHSNKKNTQFNRSNVIRVRRKCPPIPTQNIPIADAYRIQTTTL